MLQPRLVLQYENKFVDCITLHVKQLSDAKIVKNNDSYHSVHLLTTPNSQGVIHMKGRLEQSPALFTEARERGFYRVRALLARHRTVHFLSSIYTRCMPCWSSCLGLIVFNLRQGYVGGPKNVSYIGLWPNTLFSLAWLVADMLFPCGVNLWYEIAWGTVCVVRGCPFSCTGPDSCQAELH